MGCKIITSVQDPTDRSTAAARNIAIAALVRIHYSIHFFGLVGDAQVRAVDNVFDEGCFITKGEVFGITTVCDKVKEKGIPQNVGARINLRKFHFEDDCDCRAYVMVG